jgi:hypothetical protein
MNRAKTGADYLLPDPLPSIEFMRCPCPLRL